MTTDAIPGLAAPMPSSGSAPAPTMTQEQAITKAHTGAQAQFDKLRKAEQTMGQAKAVLGKLTALGDAVTEEDVIKSMGQLVEIGLSPAQLAAGMADMPQGGVALQGWLSEQEQRLGQAEQAMGMQLAKARGSLMATSLHLLAHHAQAIPGPANGPTGPELLGGTSNAD